MDYLNKNSKIDNCAEIARKIIPDSNNEITNTWFRYSRILLENILAYAIEKEDKTNDYVNSLITSNMDDLRIYISEKHEDSYFFFHDKNKRILTSCLMTIMQHTQQYDSKKQF